jgi:hypothetical protein
MAHITTKKLLGLAIAAVVLAAEQLEDVHRFRRSGTNDEEAARLSLSVSKWDRLVACRIRAFGSADRPA